MKERRQFHVVNVTRVNGCDTKWKHLFCPHDGGPTKESRTFKSIPASTPKAAASKALTRLCATKYTHGVCTFLITVRDVEKDREFTYKANRRNKVQKVILGKGKRVVTFEHFNYLKKSDPKTMPDKNASCVQTRGKGRTRAI